MIHRTEIKRRNHSTESPGEDGRICGITRRTNNQAMNLVQQRQNDVHRILVEGKGRQENIKASNDAFLFKKQIL